MGELLGVEIKSDLEYVYKNIRELLNLTQARDFEDLRPELRGLMDKIAFKLEDIEGIIQKDIFNCDYLITQRQVEKSQL